MTDLFIVCSFFFPRLTLFICWFLDMMPANDTPFALDVIAFIMAPRILIAWWLYVVGSHQLLILFFVFFGILELGSAVGYTKRERKKKKKRKKKR